MMTNVQQGIDGLADALTGAGSPETATKRAVAPADNTGVQIATLERRRGILDAIGFYG